MALGRRFPLKTGILFIMGNFLLLVLWYFFFSFFCFLQTLIIWKLELITSALFFPSCFSTGFAVCSGIFLVTYFYL